MPSSGTAKTKSVPKAAVAHEHTLTPRRMAAVLALLGFLMVLVVGFLLFLPHPGDRPTYKLVVDSNPQLPQGRGRHGGIVVSKPWTYYLRGAMTSRQQQKGLSGTKELRFNQGMIFVYNQPAERCFWMKDMHYNLDIIWVDAARRVAAVEHDIAPGTYPQKFCHAGRFVIELNAGEAAKAGIIKGRKLDF